MCGGYDLQDDEQGQVLRDVLDEVDIAARAVADELDERFAAARAQRRNGRRNVLGRSLPRDLCAGEAIVDVHHAREQPRLRFEVVQVGETEVCEAGGMKWAAKQLEYIQSRVGLQELDQSWLIVDVDANTDVQTAETCEGVAENKGNVVWCQCAAPRAED